jgi:uncharacterized protein (TIGR03083 family)
MALALDRYRVAGQTFQAVADAADGRWDAPSPCEDWTARGVLEHVIGFHEVLVLQPAGVEVRRPKDDVPGRWRVTFDALLVVLGADDPPVDQPMVDALTTELAVHSWDLARAFGIDDRVEGELWAWSLAGALEGRQARAASGMFGPEVDVDENADARTRLLGLFGRAS